MIKASPLQLILVLLCVATACKKKDNLEDLGSLNAPEKHLYVSSGLCYSGVGVTTFSTTTSSNMVYKINSSGVREGILADYNAFPAAAGDSPISIIDWDSSNLMVLVRNGTTANRLETINKTTGARSSFGTNPAIGTILSTAPLAMTLAPDGGLLMTRTGYIEKVNANGVRTSTPWVSNNLGASCGTANTLLTAIATSATGKIVTANSAASPNNRVISVPAGGASGSCTTGIAAPAATGNATAMVMDTANNKLIVAYSGNSTATDVNSIYAYDFDDTTGNITNGQKIYDASAYPATYSYLLFGISAMALDDNQLYVATAISTATTVVNYAIEKFTYDPTKIGVSNNTVLTRLGTTPFYNYGVDTKCISSIVVDY